MRTELVERENELAALHEVVRYSGRGRCQAVVVRGAAGTGKSELLAAFAEELDEALVLFAAGAVAERDIAFGVLGQLVRNPDLSDQPAQLVDQLGSGAETVAEGRADQGVRAADVRVLGLLCDLLLERAAHQSVVVLVDDAHEADEASLAAMTYLHRRLRFSRITLVLSESTVVPGPTALSVRFPGKLLVLSPLSPAGVGTLVAERMGREHAAEIYTITGGNPLLVNAVVDDQPGVRRSGYPVAEVVPGEGFVLAYLACLNRLDVATREVAHDVALLDDRVSGPAAFVAAMLGAVTPAGADQVAHALDDLEAAGVLRDGGYPHPAAKTAVARSIPAATRAALRWRIATALHLTGAEPGALADAVMAANRADEQWALDALRHGAERDVLEGHADRAARRLRLCLRDCTDAALRDRLTAQLRHVVAQQGRPGAPAPTSSSAHRSTALPGDDRLDGGRGTAPLTAEPSGPGSRADPFEQLVPMVLRHLDNRPAWSDRTSSDRASRRALAGAGGRCVVQAEALRRSGELAEAARLVRAACVMLPAENWGPALGGTLSVGVSANTAMGRLDVAAELLRTPTTESVFQTQFGLLLLGALGQHQVASGHPDKALDTFYQCGQTMIGWGIDLPTLVPWRIGAAEAQIMLGNRGAARALAAMQLERAGIDAPRTRGSALRMLALTVLPAERLALLEQSVRLLREAGDRVGLAHALRDLSCAYKLTNSPGAAHAAAEDAVALARACRIEPLITDPLLVEQVDPERAPAELAYDPVDLLTDLTDAERRVAVLAVRGHTNRQISGKLFITVSTVEQHLTRVYRKLNVSGRAALGPLISPLPELRAETAAG